MMSPAKKEHNITIRIAKHFDGPNVNIAKLRKLVKSVCSRFELTKTTVGIAIVNDTEIKRLNKQFLNRNTTTDCLSFDLTDERPKLGKHESSKHHGQNLSRRVLSAEKIFELVVNGEKAAKEAKERRHSYQAELALYVVHGLLHNLGFGDTTEAKAKKMHETEDEILQELGYGMVYNKGTRIQGHKG